MIARAGLQFHWTNPGYRDFADFLATFSHDKRKKVKQERRKVAEAGVTFERIRGPDITAADWTSSIAATSTPIASITRRPT